MRGHTLTAFVKLVIFGVVTTLLTILLAITISNGSIGGSFTTYHAIFTDATSLLPGDDVRIAGVRVGQVTGVSVYQHRYAKVDFTVQTGTPVYASTVAQLRYRNLVGQRFLELVEEPGGSLLAKGATLGLPQTRPALDLTVLFNGFQPLFHFLDPKTVNQLSYEVIQTLQGEGGTFDQLVATTSSLTNTLADRDAVVGSLVDNLNVVLGTVAQRNKGFGDLITQMDRLVTGLAADRGTIAASLANINGVAGETASLLQGIRPALPGTLSGLAQLAHTLETTRYPDGHVILDEWLKWLPWKVNTIIRTATYGGWFNFWLCDANARIGTMITPRVHVTNSPACDA